MKNNLALAVLLPAFASLLVEPAAARSWTAPEGCEIFLTVQSKGCRVSNHYRCSADAEGDQWRADFDQEGLFFRSRVNFETEWLESYDSDPPSRQVLDADPADPASFSELVASGMDTFEFSLSRDNGEHGNVTGYDRLTGRQITIDGVTLDETEFEYSEADDSGSLLRAGRGHEYINREMRLFFAGPGQKLWEDNSWLPIDGSPMDFVFPGEKGFASSQPLFDCDALTAGADAPFQLWKARHALPPDNR